MACVDKYVISVSQVDNFKRSKVGRRLGFKVGCREDVAWMNCWENVHVGQAAEAPPHDSCYKSTLIVPMTLRGHVNRADDMFADQFGLADAERAIFGYLCLDHVCTDYFFDVRDVNVCYIFADLMSFYLMTLINYVNKSATYCSAKEFAAAG